MPDYLVPYIEPVISPLVKIGFLIFVLMTAAANLVLLERWMAAWVQDRLGPNRVGPLGLLQPLADGGKFIFKEEYTPSHVDKALFILAPTSILIAALSTFAVIPFGSVLPPMEFLKIDKPEPLLTAPQVDVGVIYIFALSSIAVYGVILGAWSSNNKYSFLGGLRSSAQLIAYEIPLGLGLLGVALASGTLRLDHIIDIQAQSGVWNVVTQPLGLVVFTTAAFAEAARLPFDLPEAEQELIGGYHTEYAGIKLLLFLIAEFLHMVAASFLIVILFFGGWHFWGMTEGDNIGWIEAIIRAVVLNAKVLLVIVFFMMVRWSWPRFRFDQLMSLAWKVMLPLGLVNLVAIACFTEYGPTWAAALKLQPWVVALIVGWGVLLVGWLTTSLAAPLHDDNSPRANVREFDVDGEGLG